MTDLEKFVYYYRTILATNKNGLSKRERVLKKIFRSQMSFSQAMMLVAALREDGTFNLTSHSLWGMDLADFDFSYSKMDGVDLKEAFLCGTKLQYASLNKANFYCAELNDADLKGAHLVLSHMNHMTALNANFAQADLEKASMAESILRNANFKGANLVDVTFAYADLREADFTGATVLRCNFQGALMEKVRGLTKA